MSSHGLLSSNDVRLGYFRRIDEAWRPVIYAAVDGLAVFEGCIILGTVAEMERTTQTVAQQPLLLKDPNAEPMGIAIKGQQFRWKEKQVFFEIDANLPNQQRVHDAISHWESKTDFRFHNRKANTANYIVFRPGNGCAANVGMQGGPQSVILGSGCSTGNAIHEIGHAIGLWHEQSRADRDSFIDIVWQNIDPNARHNFEQHVIDGIDLGNYDYESIMHYPANAFSVNGSDTIKPKQAGVEIGQRRALSAGDVDAVKNL
jgi:hypothetical protein